MDIKQDQAFKRLLKKLSALRATLTNNERSLLDELITGSADEMKAHSMKVSSASPRTSPKTAPAADEMKAHSMLVTPISPRTTPKTTPAASEVAAHSMKVSAATPRTTPRTTPAADEVAAHRMEDERPTLERVTHRVVYDPIKEEYQRIP